ncbi:MAG TPA: TonB-dependent receptor [Burkholderiaceae bacterium]
MASRIRSRSTPRPSHAPLAAAALLALAGGVHAQSTAGTATQSVQVVGHEAADASDLTGFSQPLARTPIQATTIDASALADIGATSLSDLTRLDASVTDSYNAPGYWSTFAIRGFQVDNRYNFRRDGLPINAETVLSLDNKSGVEVLKGLSGMQAGTSAPGGLVDLEVKRPDADLREAALRWSQDGTIGAAVDLSQRFGSARQFGARLNVAADRLDPNYRDDRGHRESYALATDWRIDARHLLEFEFEHNLQSQPSVPGFSMTGDVVPDPHAVDPHVNLNDQPWTLPVVTQGNTMSLRYTQALGEHWHLRVHAMQQQLVSNDRLAFDYGVYSADGSTCDPCDRFASDGSYSIWDYRSEDERRRMRVLDSSVGGDFATGPVRHALTAGVLVSRFVARFNDQAYNLVGTGTMDGSTFVPADPTPTSPTDDRTERNTELYLRDALQLGDDWSAWVGLRRTQLHRASWPTSLGDPSTATDYRQAFTTPWLSLSRQLTPADMVYASWGEGVESDVTPNLPSYAHPGRPVPASTSRQWEAGWKHAHGADHWGLDAYDVQQPQWIDVDDGSGLLERVRDGIVESHGIEAEAQTRLAALTLRASAMWQRVRRAKSSDPAGNGLRPTNVPDTAYKLSAAYDVAALPGLSALVDLGFEGDREVLPDDSARIPGWTRVDLGTRYVQNVGGTRLTWRAGVNNLFDRRAWREAPYQYDHAYLFPLEPRTFFASIDASF